MSNLDVYVLASDEQFYRSPIIQGIIPKTITKRDKSVINQTTRWMIRFDADIPRLLIERKAEPERPLNPTEVLAVSGLVCSLTKGRGKSGGYVDFTGDSNHVPAIEYEIKVFRAIKTKDIKHSLGAYKRDEIPSTAVVYDFQ